MIQIKRNGREYIYEVQILYGSLFCKRLLVYMYINRSLTSQNQKTFLYTFIMSLVYLMLLLLIYCSEITENSANKTGNAQELAAIKMNWKTQLNETLPHKQAIKKPSRKTNVQSAPPQNEMNAWVKEVKTQFITCFGYTCIALYATTLFVGIIALITLSLRPD